MYMWYKGICQGTVTAVLWSVISKAKIQRKKNHDPNPQKKKKT